VPVSRTAAVAPSAETESRTDRSSVTGRVMPPVPVPVSRTAAVAPSAETESRTDRSSVTGRVMPPVRVPVSRTAAVAPSAETESRTGRSSVTDRVMPLAPGIVWWTVRAAGILPPQTCPFTTAPSGGIREFYTRPGRRRSPRGRRSSHSVRAPAFRTTRASVTGS
jgi:hypothetical protein